MEKRRTKEWYCWVIVAACLLLSAASIGMLSYFNALFVTPVCESLHIARSSLSLMSTFSTVTTMLLLPFVGKLYDHIPMKLLVLLGAIAGGCAHLCYSLAQNTILFYLGGILSGIGACLACVCKSKEKDAHSNVNNKRICKDGPVFLSTEVEI